MAGVTITPGIGGAADIGVIIAVIPVVIPAVVAIANGATFALTAGAGERIVSNAAFAAIAN